MYHRNPFADDAWRWKCGLPSKYNEEKISISELRKTEWSTEFENLMRNRLVMGGLRYGRMGHGAHPYGKPKYDRCESIRKRLDFFEKTGNAEWLVDIANMSLLMFEERQHPNWHFLPEDDGYHDEIIK